MSLAIAWSNPLSPVRAEKSVRRLSGDRFLTVYLVTERDATQSSFELYPGGQTESTDLCRDLAEVGSTPDSSSSWAKNGDDTDRSDATVSQAGNAEGSRCLNSGRKANPS